MLNKSQAEDVVRRMTLAAKAGQRQMWSYDLDLRLDYYEGRQLNDLRAAIRRRYPRTGEHVLEDAVTYNLIRQIVDARSQVYHRPPTRTLVSAKTGEALKPEAPASKIWIDLVERGEFDNRLELVNQRVNLWKSSVVWPRFRELNGERWIKLEVVGPHQIWVLQDASNVDELQACESVAILLAGRIDSQSADGPSEFGCYTQDGQYYQFHGEVDGEGQLRMLDITQEAKPHGYGMIPLIAFHDGIPSGQLWVTEDEDMVIANRAINVMLTDLEHLRKRQAHSTLVRKGLLDAKTAEVVIGADAVIDLQGDAQEDAYYISPNARILECKELVEQAIKLQASNRGISPNRFSVTERNAMSGVAKALDEMDLLEDVARQQRRYARPEARLFDAIRAVWNASVESGSWLPKDVYQQVGYVPFAFQTDPSIEWKMASEQAEKGARPMYSLTLFYDRDLDEKGQQEAYERNMAALAEHKSALAPSSPFAGILSGRAKAKPASKVAPDEKVNE